MRARSINKKALFRWAVFLSCAGVVSLALASAERQMLQGLSSLLLFCAVFSLFSFALHFFGIASQEPKNASFTLPERLIAYAFPLALVFAVGALVSGALPLAAFCGFVAYACADEMQLRRAIVWSSSGPTASQI